MICLHCGYCCVQHDVVIIHPTYINEINTEDDIDRHMLMHKPGQIACPHLYESDDNKLLCQIHDKPWYNSTPCAKHTQIERENTECRIGRYIIDNSENNKLFHMIRNIRRGKSCDNG